MRVWRKRIAIWRFVLKSYIRFDIRIFMKKSNWVGFILIFAVLTGCAEHRVDTFQEWCELISEEKPFAKNTPFWIINTTVSIDEEKIRNDFALFINRALLKKAKSQSAKMAWRQDKELHIVNLAGLLNVEPEIMSEKWRQGIKKALENKYTDSKDICLYVTLTRLFESLHIHTKKTDQMGSELADEVTILATTGSESEILNE
jgi:hypothetical protein